METPNAMDIVSLFPKVLDSVVGIEKVAKGIPGPTKKAIFLNTLSALAKAGRLVPVPMISLISNMVDVVVTELNDSGVFTKSEEVKK